jgi:hypothetical protein
MEADRLSARPSEDASEQLERLHLEAAWVARRIARVLLQRHPDAAELERLDARAAVLRQRRRALSPRRSDDFLWSGIRSPAAAAWSASPGATTSREPIYD